MDTIDLTKANLSMRIPTNVEWDRLMDSVSGDDAVVHWMDIFSWTEDWKFTSGSVRWVRGFSSAYARSDSGASYRGNIVGFRPAFDLDTDILPSGIQYGDAVIVGTLYMDGRPVKIPQKPSCTPRDIADYIPGARLEMRPALAAPAYQVTGIFVDGSIVADRCILKNISYRDVKSAIQKDRYELEMLSAWTDTESAIDYRRINAVFESGKRTKFICCFDSNANEWSFFYAEGEKPLCAEFEKEVIKAMS